MFRSTSKYTVVPFATPDPLSVVVTVTLGVGSLVWLADVSVTVGTLLSNVYVWSVAGSPVGSALPARSVMFCDSLRFRPTTPLKLARLPPDTVTSYVVPLTGLTSVTVAVVSPFAEKSPIETSVTSSSKVARNSRVSAFVRLVTGV